MFCKTYKKKYNFIWVIAGLTVANLIFYSSSTLADKQNAATSEAKKTTQLKAPAKPNNSQSDTRVASKFWDKFIIMVRRGDMRSAYECFSLESRKGMTYAEFCAQYNPVTAANEALLAPAQEIQLKIAGEKALIRYIAAAQEPEAAGTLVQAYLIKESNNWQLVTSAKWSAASIEADARTLLRHLDKVLHDLARKNKLPSSFAQLKKDYGESVDSILLKSVESTYKIILANTKPDGWKMLLKLRNKKQGLKSYWLNNCGNIQQYQDNK